MPPTAPWQQAIDEHIGDDPPGPVTDEAVDMLDDPAEWTTPDADDDAVEELIRVAVVSRPLDDVVALVTRLEQSPDSLPTAASVLRLAAVARSVDDVTRLVDLLGPPKHPAGHMDDAIRHAAEERPIPEVSRLVHLLSRPPQDPHAGAEAVHAAATSRSVEDLMQLIGSLKDHKDAEISEAEAWPPAASAAALAEAIAPDTSTTTTTDASADTGTGTDTAAENRRTGYRALAWLSRVAGVLVLLCAAAHFPLNWTDAPTVGLWAALAVFAVCAAAGVALCLTRSAVVAVASTLAAGALAVAHLVDDRIDSTTLGYVLQPGGLASPLPAIAAAVAALASLLVVALAVAGLRAAAADPHRVPQ
ncbi:hypothetical protein [Streptomyces sp. NPDC048436]|uniref:hypothetical protein n=1 Tax=Streptomyces sp. NPDC048436 TaxID=3365550 RepID=UPI0037221A0D